MGFWPREAGAAVVQSGPDVDWEETRCLLCGSGNSQLLVEGSDKCMGNTGLWFAVVQCQECGLCFTNPRPTKESIGSFYQGDYQPHHLKQRRRQQLSWRERVFQFLPRSERNFLPVFGNGRLLDFGCGGGSFLERMHKQGWQVTGLDMAMPAVERIRGELGLHALHGTLPHPELAPSSFEMITMWQALEHVHEPLLVLRQARRLLVPGGKILVAVPNIDSLAFRWFGNAWFGLDVPRHLTHFTAWTLTQMLQMAGFHVGPVRMQHHSKWLRSSAQLACRSGRRPYWHHWLKSRFIASVATWFSYVTSQADGIIVVAENR